MASSLSSHSSLPVSASLVLAKSESSSPCAMDSRYVDIDVDIDVDIE